MPQRIARVIRNGRYDATDIVRGLLTIWWGAWVAAPWDVYATNPSYKKLATLASEALVGSVMLLIGFGVLAAAFLPPRPKRLVLGVAFIAWSVIAAAFTYSNWRGTSTVLYCSVAIGFLVAALRVRPVLEAA